MSFEPDLWTCSKSLGDSAPAGLAVGAESFQIAQTLKIPDVCKLVLHSSSSSCLFLKEMSYKGCQ